MDDFIAIKHEVDFGGYLKKSFIEYLPGDEKFFSVCKRWNKSYYGKPQYYHKTITLDYYIFNPDKC